MVIDIHTHAFPEKVAAKAIETLEAIYGVKALSGGTIDELLTHMAESGVDTSVVLAVSTAPRQVISINTWISSLYRMHPGSTPASGSNENSEESCPPLIGFGTIHPEFEGYRDEIQRMKELGIKGVKFQPSFQKFYPDDERMFPIYAEIIKAGLIILFHAGDEIKPVTTVYSTPRRLARMLDAMQSEIDSYEYRAQTGSVFRVGSLSPRTRGGFAKQRATSGSPGTAKIVIAHLGGYKMWDQVEEYLIGRDIYFGVSYVFGHLDPARALRMIRAHGTDRILFGSDFPFDRQSRDIEAILQLDIAQEEKEKILGKNALRLLT